MKEKIIKQRKGKNKNMHRLSQIPERRGFAETGEDSCKEEMC